MQPATNIADRREKEDDGCGRIRELEKFGGKKKIEEGGTRKKETSFNVLEAKTDHHKQKTGTWKKRPGRNVRKVRSGWQQEGAAQGGKRQKRRNKAEENPLGLEGERNCVVQWGQETIWWTQTAMLPEATEKKSGEEPTNNTPNSPNEA